MSHLTDVLRGIVAGSSGGMGRAGRVELCVRKGWDCMTLPVDSETPDSL